MRKATKTGQREQKEYAAEQAFLLRTLAADVPSGEARLLLALAQIRARDGVKLQRHSDAAGTFVDDFIDDIIRKRLLAAEHSQEGERRES